MRAPRPIPRFRFTSEIGVIGDVTVTSFSDPFASDPFASRSPSYPGGSPTPSPMPPSLGNGSVDPSHGGQGLAVAGPPTWLLAVVGVLAVIGIGIGVLASSGPVAIAGWALAGPAAIGVLSAFTLLDTKRRAMPVYTQPTWLTAAYGCVLALAGVGIVIGALRIADWVGRL